MNEFYTPDRQNDIQTDYAEPADEIKIVVDEGGERNFCSRCGNRLEPEDVFCSKCGAQTYGANTAVQRQPTAYRRPHDVSQSRDSTGNVYNYYNYNYTNSNNTVNSNNAANTLHAAGNVKSKYTALLLCLFLGWIGAHRFYEGKIATGILWALSFALGGIGWIIDLLILLFKPRWYTP